jgi:hypothetical protein
MNLHSQFFTDTATLALFDPERLSHRAAAESDWWCSDLSQLAELQSGSFESTTRRVGPEPGMILTTKVRRGASNELCLKECGPCRYRASVVDYSGVAWKDTIRLKVLEVDHGAKHLVGEFVGKVER